MRRRPRRRRGRALRVLAALLLLLVLLALVGALYQARATAADRARYAPPGDLVNVEGRQMHLHCQGEGTPTVVLDAGQGGWSSDWTDLAPRLADTTRVCAYDRAGYGWSDPAPGERTPQAQADGLAALLDAAAVETPYVLVAFSAAGLSARLLAAQHPEDVAGLVLVDPATEFDNDLLGEDGLRQQRAALGTFQAFELAARVGLVRLLDPREMAPYAPFLARDPVEPGVYYSFVSEPGWWRTSRREFAARLRDDTLRHVRENGAIPDDLPLVVVGAERGAGADSPELEEARRERLRALAEASEGGRFVLAENSSHDVVHDRPDVVVEAVRDVMDAAKER